MHVAVAIVGYKNAEDIAECLKALAATLYSDFEVVICENGGPDAYARLRAETPDALPGGQPVRITLAPRNLGYAGGVNVCIREAEGADAWWVLNPDTAPEPAAMGEMVDRLRRGDCDAVGSVVYTPDGRIQSLGGLWRPSSARAVSLGFGEPLERVHELADDVERRQNYLNGASMMVSRRFWAETGPMQEDYFLYCEEVEWCLRGLSRGLRLGLAHAARVLHYRGTTTGNESDIRRQGRLSVYLNERNRLLLTRDRFPQLLPVAAPLAASLILGRFARRGAWRQVGYGFEGWLAGLRGERGPAGA